MTILQKRQNIALLVVDVQNSVVERAYKRDAVIANVLCLVEKARRERVPGFWVQHSGEQLVEKHYGDSFEAATLENVLSDLGIGRLVAAGAQTDACIRSR